MIQLRWLRENGERLLLSALAGLALTVAGFAIVTEWLGLAHSHYLQQHVPAGILALLATYILFFLFGFERRVSQMKSTIDSCQRMVEESRAGIGEHIRRWEALGITEFYRSRNAPGQKQAYLRLIRGAAGDLFIVGVTLKDFTFHEQPTILEKAAAGCSVRLLMLTPERWPNEQPVLDPVESGDLKDHFTSALRNIRKLALTLAKRKVSTKPATMKKILRTSRKHRGRPVYSLEVRFYDQSPALSMAVADGDLASGRMRVEFTPHNENDKGDYFRPMMDLSPVGNEGLFQQFYLHYTGLWDKSKPYLCVSGSKIYFNKQFDEQVSKLLGLPVDWVPEHLSAQDPSSE